MPTVEATGLVGRIQQLRSSPVEDPPPDVRAPSRSPAEGHGHVAAGMTAGAVVGAAVAAVAGAVTGAKAGRAVAAVAAGAVTGAVLGNIAAETRATWGISQKTLARMVGCSERTLASLEAGEPLRGERRRRFVEIRRLHAALSRIMRPESLAGWLDEAIPAFGGSTPLQVIERGEVDRIWEMIYDVRMGEAF
jgi:transcriptional regulator with XRE-family HTH domain